MSNAGNTNTNPNAEAIEMREKFEKKGKVVVMKNDNQDAFLEFVSGLSNYTDLTQQAPASFTGGYAMVETQAQVMRLIALPTMEEAFMDPVVRAALYKMYVNRKVNHATDDDANPADFITVAGGFKQKFDIEAFKFQAKAWTKYLRDRGLTGVTNQSLRLAFQSAAYAKSQFPRMVESNWTKLIEMAKAMAEKHGMETGIFDHWLATRAVASADTSEITLDFGDDEMGKMDEALTEKLADKSENAPAA
jgi:hypothetical protein